MLHRGRSGKVTSSECFKIYESKTVQETYLEELRIFRLFNQQDVEKDVFNFKWGHLLENYLHDKTDHFKGYINQNMEDEATVFSAINELHCGTPDQYTVQDESIVMSETKCPVTLKGLYNLIFPFYTKGYYEEVSGNEAIELIKSKSKDGKKYFWQIISNAILIEEHLGVSCDYGELTAFMPYSTDIPKVVSYSEEFFTSEYYPILFGTSGTLPCLKASQDNEDSFDDLEDRFPVRDIHKIRFDISEELKETFRNDIKKFTERI